MTPFLEKTIKYLGKCENPAAIELLRPLLAGDDLKVRGLAFEGLYIKRDPEILRELFAEFVANPERWQNVPQVTPERLGKMVQAVLESNDMEQIRAAVPIIRQFKIFEAMTSFVTLLESSDNDSAKFGAEGIMMLGEMFYTELLGAATPTDRSNLDRKRQWITSELDGVAKRYSVHGFDEPIKALLLVSKKDYETFQSITADFHSSVCKRMMEILATENHPGYYRLLLSFVDDPDSPPAIDLILADKQEPLFVQNLLKVVGNNPDENAKKGLRRLKGFTWLRPNNPQLPELIKDLEVPFIRLITSMALPREELLALFRFMMNKGTPEGRRAAAEALRPYPGDDFNALILEVIDDPDPTVCAHLLRILKNRGVKEADAIIARCVERNSEIVNKTIYDLMPDYRIDSFLSRMGQYPESQARDYGRIVCRVDPNTVKIIGNEISSFVPLRRAIACDAARFTGLCAHFKEQLYKIGESDEEASTRAAAFRALSELLTKEAFIVLQNGTTDRSLAVREAAELAVRHWAQMAREATAGT